MEDDFFKMRRKFGILIIFLLTLIPVNAQSGNFHFGVISAVKDKVEEIKEEREKDKLPTVTINEPVNGSKVLGSVNITAEAVNTVKVEFYIDGVLKATDITDPYSYILDTTLYANGTHTIEVKAHNAEDQITTLQYTITIDNDYPPSITIPSLAGNPTLSGIVDISPEVSDDKGIAKVEFYLEGTLVSTDTNFSYNYSWNTNIYVNGSYTIGAKVYDTANQTANIQYVVTVNNVSTDNEVTVKKTGNSNWQLMVDDSPYFIQGMTYVQISKVGQSPNGEWIDWQKYDYNSNGENDVAYDSWVDKNGNNIQDADESVVGDWQLLKEMGVNTIRWYHGAFNSDYINKELFRDLYQKYGIMVAVGNFLGAYTIGSGASWELGTDYTNVSQKELMKENVRKMVIEHKDEPYLLLWLLGNENNYSFTRTNAGTQPEAYAKFLNEVAELIHQLDGRHPVAFVNGGTDNLSYYAIYAPAIDIFAMNSYPSDQNFDSQFSEIKNTYDKPVLLSEFGSDPNVDEEGQATYNKGCWLNIIKNKAGSGYSGNVIGGFVFEWLDQWWPVGDPYYRDPVDLSAGFGFSPGSEENAGVCSQGDGSQSPFLRKLKKVYNVFKDELWNQ